MDVLWFLKQRTAFIRQFYKTAATPFSETIRKIEAGEEPYEPPYSEDPEPPFMQEWTVANTSLEILGAAEAGNDCRIKLNGVKTIITEQK